MELLGLLLSDWVGRLTLFIVLFCVGMVAYIAVYFIRLVRKAEKAEASAEGHLPHGGIPKT